MILRERRDVLRGIGLILPMGTTGCLGLTTQDSIEIEYQVWGPTTEIQTEVSEDLAEELLEAVGREAETWVVVDVDMQSGEIESGDLFRGTHVEANGYIGSMVGVYAHSPTPEEIITSSDENYSLFEGARADLYYHIAHPVEQAEWVTRGLEGEFDSITLVDRTA